MNHKQDKTYAVTVIGGPDGKCVHPVVGWKNAQRTAELFRGIDYETFTRKAQTSPIHNGKKPTRRTTPNTR